MWTRPGSTIRLSLLVLGAAGACVATFSAAAQTTGEQPFTRARTHARQFERAVGACRRVLQAWLAYADPGTLLLPDRPDPDRATWIYTPHNSGADLYPYLILLASEMIGGVELAPGNWIVEPAGDPPYATRMR